MCPVYVTYAASLCFTLGFGFTCLITLWCLVIKQTQESNFNLLIWLFASRIEQILKYC